ncbi:hypothetical protein B1A99_25050 [Cohnella sp. CIP 111063]|uniref:hypothetical protein n=1 Tax=unclassified Cohnella TaxID=2636738 RepID=UPI000B9D3991|nr:MULTISPECIES: hypothetical protein [unclassified Cohnella]OXS55050.1 hypothetical protein B1A99_25050 [Cohnella sp. CIP 111063]
MGELIHIGLRGRKPENFYSEYLVSSVDWLNNGFMQSLYEGYPNLPPNDPPLNGMSWCALPLGARFGVWIYNPYNAESNYAKIQGWNPFVRWSSTPAYEPLNVSSAVERHNLAWIVDKEGYGQYGKVFEDGTVWVPYPRPKNWNIN